MTEPGTGSDLRGIRTSARRDDNGDWIRQRRQTNEIMTEIIGRSLLA